MKFAKEYAVKLSSEEYEYHVQNLDNKKSQEMLFRGHIHWALKISGKYFSDRYPRNELDSEALVALWKAIKEFDPSKGYKLSTFMTPVVHHTMNKYLRKHIDHPTDLSINQPMCNENPNGDSVSNLIDIIEDRHDYIEQHETSIMVQEALKLLTKDEKEIIIDHYLNDMSQPMIAQKMNCSQVNVSRLLKRARGRMAIYLARGIECRGNVYTADVDASLILIKKDMSYLVK